MDYWELDLVSANPTVEVLYSSGIKCSNASHTVECLAEFDALTHTDGFSPGCLPSHCYKYIRYQHEDVVAIAHNKEEVHGFLGDIDTSSDAILWAMVNGYYFSTTDKKAGAIQETSTGYQMLATKMVRYCSPVQTNRFLLHISKSGQIKILGEEVFTKNENACI